MGKSILTIVTLILGISPAMRVVGQSRLGGVRQSPVVTQRPVPSTYVVLEVRQDSGGGDIVENAIRVIRKRLTLYGVASHEVRRHGDVQSNRIYARWSPTRNPERLKSLIRLGGFELRGLVGPPAPTPFTYPSWELAQQASPRSRPYGLADSIAGFPHAWVNLENEMLVTSQDVLTARAIPYRTNPGKYKISYQLTTIGARRVRDWAAMTRNNYLAVLLNGLVVNITSARGLVGNQGEVEANGGFTKEEAEDVVIVMKSGAMPARLLVFVEEGLTGAEVIAERGGWPPPHLRGLSLTKQAEMYVRNWWDEHFTPCRGGYVTYDFRLLHLRDITFSASPRRLTEADRLNGIEWSGSASAVAAFVRQSPGTGTWLDWTRSGGGMGGSYTFSAERRNGRWKFSLIKYGGEPSKAMCPTW